MKAKKSVKKPEEYTFGMMMADKITSVIGSWRFVLTQSGIILFWISMNVFSPIKWDPYPFILLNLALSFQAAYTAPMIMMSQNRQAEKDRIQAGQDYNINILAETENVLMLNQLKRLEEKIDNLNKKQ